MLQIRRIGHRSAVALSSLMCQITADVPVSDIIIGLTLVFKSDNIHKKIETESNRDRIVDRKIDSKSIEIDKAES